MIRRPFSLWFFHCGPLWSECLKVIFLGLSSRVERRKEKKIEFRFMIVLKRNMNHDKAEGYPNQSFFSVEDFQYRDFEMLGMSV